MGKLTEKQLDALELIEEISARADAMKMSLVAYPVTEIRELTAVVRRAAFQDKDPSP